MDIVETFHTVCCSACASELVAGLLRPRLFPFGKLSKAKVSSTVVDLADDVVDIADDVVDLADDLVDLAGNAVDLAHDFVDLADDVVDLGNGGIDDSRIRQVFPLLYQLHSRVELVEERNPIWQIRLQIKKIVRELL